MSRFPILKKMHSLALFRNCLGASCNLPGVTVRKNERKILSLGSGDRGRLTSTNIEFRFLYILVTSPASLVSSLKSKSISSVLLVVWVISELIRRKHQYSLLSANEMFLYRYISDQNKSYLNLQNLDLIPL